jgi:alpha-L-fucosidase 2
MSVSRRDFLGISGATLAGAAGLSSDDRPPRLHNTMDSPDAWRRFLAGQDLVWRRMPVNLQEGPFLGNGGLGVAVYRHPDRQRLTLVFGDSRVRDHQTAGGVLFGGSRLRIGYLTLETAADITDVDLRLSLWDAELTGTLGTAAGTVALRAFVHATDDLLVVNARATGGERVGWTFTPFPAASPRLRFKPRPDGLLDNPEPVLRQDAGGGRCDQDLAIGGRTSTGWLVRLERDGSRTLIGTVAHSHPDTSASTTADRVLGAAARRPLAVLARGHTGWWHAYYPKSFLSVPDGRLQSFYWIQLYKMASATRVDRPVMGTCAQWLEPTPWPGTWWNLNVQLEYWLINATGHTELDSLSRSLSRYRQNLTGNVPEPYRADSALIARTSQEDLASAEPAVPGQTGGEYGVAETGNLTWALHNAWLSYRHTMDERVLRDTIYPLLRRAVNYYLHFLAEGTDGRLHLPTTYSPEYGSAPDTNYDLALLTWGCRTLLAATDRLHVDDPLRPKWTDVLARLATPPQGPDGLWIGAGTPLAMSHRHFSHLLWFYPLQVMDARDPAGRDLLTRSLAHWVGFTGALQGYTFTGASSMSSLLGNGDDALSYLDTLLATYLKPNTMYAESGPVMETPLAGAQSLHDMLVQSRDGVVRVFPAVPSSWPEVTVHDLRAEGGFTLSAVRRGGRTAFVRIRSLAGEPCRLVPGDLPGPYAARRLDGRHGGVPVRAEGDGVLALDLRRGDDVLLHTRGVEPDTTIAPAPVDAAPPWGLA